MFTANGGPGAALFREYQSLKYRGLKMIDIDVEDREKVGVVPMANQPGAKTPTLALQRCRKSGKNITNMQGRDGYNYYLGCVVCYDRTMTGARVTKRMTRRIMTSLSCMVVISMIV